MCVPDQWDQIYAELGENWQQLQHVSEGEVWLRHRTPSNHAHRHLQWSTGPPNHCIRPVNWIDAKATMLIASKNLTRALSPFLS